MTPTPVQLLLALLLADRSSRATTPMLAQFNGRGRAHREPPRVRARNPPAWESLGSHGDRNMVSVTFSAEVKLSFS